MVFFLHNVWQIAGFYFFNDGLHISSKEKAKVRECRKARQACFCQEKTVLHASKRAFRVKI